jgi:TolA-binding protein
MVPAARPNTAATLGALKNADDARKTLQDLVARYPGTNAATLAARRLSALQ